RLQPAASDPPGVPRLDLPLHPIALLEERHAARRELHDAAARIGWIDDAFDRPLAHQLVDKLLHRLLADTEQAGQLGLRPPAGPQMADDPAPCLGHPGIAAPLHLAVEFDLPLPGEAPEPPTDMVDQSRCEFFVKC